MAHELDFTRGKAAMVYTGQTPWHGLGTRLPNAVTTADALKLAGLDYKVAKVPLYASIVTANGTKMEPVQGRWGVIRTDTNKPFDGVSVGQFWTPFQNNEGCSMMDALQQEKLVNIETAGAIKGGAQVWMLAKLDGVVKVKGKDVSETYLLWTNGHDGKRMVTFAVTTVRVVCSNTLTAAIAGATAGSVVRFRHDGKMGTRVTEAREMLGLANKSLAELEEKMNALAGVKVKSADDLDKFLKSLGFDTDAEKGYARERANAVRYSFEAGPGSDLASAKGTWWGAVCAVTDFVDHFAPRETAAQKERAFANAMYGTGNQTKTEAFVKAMEMAGLTR